MWQARLYRYLLLPLLLAARKVPSTFTLPCCPHESLNKKGNLEVNTHTYPFANIIFYDFYGRNLRNSSTNKLLLFGYFIVRNIIKNSDRIKWKLTWITLILLWKLHKVSKTTHIFKREPFKNFKDFSIIWC